MHLHLPSAPALNRLRTLLLVWAVSAPATSCARSPAPAAEPTPAVSATHSQSAPQKPAAGTDWHLGTPVIDSHVHVVPTMLGLGRAIEVFDRVGVGRFAIKSAGVPGSIKYRASLAMARILGDRMRAFSNLGWRDIDKADFVSRQVKGLEQAKRDGIVGIKIFKALGLSVRTPDGKLLAVDDPMLGPIFDTCGRLGLVVAWHVADPVAFFEPVAPENERYDELKMAQGWSFHGKDYPSHDALIAARDRVLERHPQTVFLLIHLGNYPEDLDYVDRMLDTHPNVFVDIAARVPEFGRHPADKVRAFFVKHQDRILFGSDFIAGADGGMQLGSVSEKVPTVEDAVEFYTRHWHYFETHAKQIEHPTPIQGRWRVNAVGLPAEVLRKLYVTNAEKLIFSGEHPRPRP